MLTAKEIWTVKNRLFIDDMKPGIVPKLSEYVFFNHKDLMICASTMAMSDIKLLLDGKEITRFHIEHSKILDDYSNQLLSNEESFKFILESLPDTKSNKPQFSFRFEEMPQNWLELLYESECKFSEIEVHKISIILDNKKTMPVNFELLHKFLSTQEEGFRFTFATVMLAINYFDHEFYNYFKECENPNAAETHSKNLLIYTFSERNQETLYFEPILNVFQ